jgi:hypothetical protein
MSMIIGTHAAIHSTNPEADTRILRDVLGLAAIDAGGAVILRSPLGERCTPIRSRQVVR